MIIVFRLRSGGHWHLWLLVHQAEVMAVGKRDELLGQHQHPYPYAVQ